MRKPTVSSCLVVLPLAILGMPGRAWAWGEEGHVIVARIAELNLTPEAKAAIQKLLGPTPISDRRIATFADMVKHNPRFPQFAASAPWHFVDIPLEKQYDVARDCVDNKCAVAKIEEFRNTLADQSKPADQRLEALIFLVHLVGDLHQPLHCANRNDLGGNMLPVKFLGHGGNHLNLHSAWDSNIVLACMGDLLPPDYAFRLNEKIQDPDRTQWQQGDISQWANESHQAAEEHAYKRPNGEWLPTTGTPNLDQDYVDAAKKVVDVQLQRGGVRLAKILNDSLK